MIRKGGNRNKYIESLLQTRYCPRLWVYARESNRIKVHTFLEFTFEGREIDGAQSTQCQLMSVMDRSKDPGDRKQVVREDVMEKVTFEPRPEEGEGRDLSISELLGD